MNPSALALVLALGVAACDDSPVAAPDKGPDASATRAAPSKATVYGRVVADAQRVEIADLVARAKDFDGKVVRVEGTVSGVCEKRGCWIDVAERDGPNEVRLKVADGEIVFPMSAKGSAAVAYGTVRATALDLEKTRQRAARRAKERGEPFDPASVTEPGTAVRLDGIGAEIAGAP